MFLRMFSIKNNIFYLVVINIFVEIHSLVQLPDADYNEIAITEATIRHTINTLFTSLKLRKVKRKTRFKEFAAIHNLFASITLKDDDSLKEIAKLAKADNIDNSTQDFTTLLNEILDEDNKSDEAKEDVYVTTHIETFIKKLEYLKYKYGLKSNVGNYDINEEILHHLITAKMSDFQNLTEEIKKTNDSDENVLSDNEFWQPSGRRIFEGHRVTIQRYPFMASVQFFKKFQCGGSIIKSDLVITAASCLQLAWNNRFFRENPSFLSVQVGSDFYERGDENIPVLEVYFHPEYDPKTLRNNLAVMRLRRILKFGKKVTRVKKIDFDRKPWQLPESTQGITIVGWGARGTSNIVNDPWYNRLGVAQLDFYSLKECQNVYSKEYVTLKNFCAGFFSKGSGACNRDVGGPGIVQDILVGVVSFGSPNCGAPDAPTVFTKLGHYTEWLEGIMELNVPSIRGRTTETPIKVTEFYRDVHNAMTTFKVSPVTDPQGRIKPIPIHEVDVLRTDDSVLFKEFIATMFDSKEVEEVLNEFNTKDEKTIETKSLPASKEITRAKIISTTEPYTKDNDRSAIEEISATDLDTVRLVKMVTTIDRFDRIDGSQESLMSPDSFTKSTYLVEDKEGENKMEQKIAKLIDDIDIQDLLEINSKDIDVKDKAKIDLEGKSSEEGIEKLEENIEESGESEESEDSSSDANSGEPSINTNERNEENINKNKPGLSIPVKTEYNDLTFRQNTTGFLDLFSQDELLRLLTEAIAESEFLNKHF